MRRTLPGTRLFPAVGGNSSSNRTIALFSRSFFSSGEPLRLTVSRRNTNRTGESEASDTFAQIRL